jgi:hypothetical protein
MEEAHHGRPGVPIGQRNYFAHFAGWCASDGHQVPRSEPAILSTEASFAQSIDTFSIINLSHHQFHLGLPHSHVGTRL